ncbi:MAG: LysR family transcriptional regulator [Desulfovibrionaceae bacterium]
MDWQQLKNFYLIVRLGSMTRAAEASFRTQSALSQQINKLEQDLHCTLFKRIGKTALLLTKEGEEVLQFAEDIFLRERYLYEQLDKLSSTAGGTVHIAAPYAVLEFLLVDLLGEYAQQFPEISLHILHQQPQTAIDQLAGGEIDFAFLHNSTIPHTFEKYPWKKGHYMFVVPHGHPVLLKEKPHLADIIQYPLNLATRHVKLSARDKLDKTCQEMGLTYKVAVESPNVLLKFNYVMRGIGISFNLCYDAMIEQFSDRLAFIGLPDIFPDETISIALRKNSVLTSYKKHFLDFILKN